MDDESAARDAAMDAREKFLRQIAPDSQFHLLFDHLEGLHFFAKDRDGRMMYVSRTSLARFGLEHEWEVVGKIDTDLAPRRLAERYVADDAWIYQTGQPLLNRVELWLNPQGVPDWFLTNKLPIYSRSSEIIGIMGVLQSYERRKHYIESYLAIDAAVEFIGEHYAQPLRVAQLAKLCHLSVRQLERKFLNAFRMTPQEFIIHTRIQFACEALLQSRSSMSQIALETGFQDQSAFTRQFRQQIGMTPRQYRHRLARCSG